MSRGISGVARGELRELELPPFLAKTSYLYVLKLPLPLPLELPPLCK